MDLQSAAKLLRWFDGAKRDLPWRQTSDPYAIWVSEVMLQQTRVATVEPYFRRWMAHFPTVQELANADEQEVLSLWQGLGYYSRCKTLLRAARIVAQNGFPASRSEWKGLPGIGDYTSGAISSIAQGCREPVVDGNIERVYARLCADSSLGGELRRNAWDWASRHVHATRPGDWNQALMELGATVCKPTDPACIACPLAQICEGRKRNAPESYPAAKPKVQVRRMQRFAAVPIRGDLFGLRQIPVGQWWSGMWEFPKWDDLEAVRGAFNAELISVGQVHHSVTNHRITLEAFVVQVDRRLPCFQWLEPASLVDLPMPSPDRRLLGLSLQELANSRPAPAAKSGPQSSREAR